MSTFDLKSFMINEGLTRVSQDRKKLLKENAGEKSLLVKWLSLIKENPDNPEVGELIRVPEDLRDWAENIIDFGDEGGDGDYPDDYSEGYGDIVSVDDQEVFSAEEFLGKFEPGTYIVIEDINLPNVADELNLTDREFESLCKNLEAHKVYFESGPSTTIEYYFRAQTV